jgi:hypothetical protein
MSVARCKAAGASARAEERRRDSSSGKLCPRCSDVFGGSQCFGRNVCAVWPTHRSAGYEELLKSAHLSQRLEDRATKPPREIYRFHRAIVETEAEPITGGVPSVYDGDELVHSGPILAEESGSEDRASSLGSNSPRVRTHAPAPIAESTSSLWRTESFPRAFAQRNRRWHLDQHVPRESVVERDHRRTYE